jgi:hypothetical protein
VCVSDDPSGLERGVESAVGNGLWCDDVSVFAKIAAGGSPPSAGTPDDGGGVVAGLRALIEADRRVLAQLEGDPYDGLVGKAAWARQRARLTDRIAARQRDWRKLLPQAASAVGSIDVATVADQWRSVPQGGGTPPRFDRHG